MFRSVAGLVFGWVGWVSVSAAVIPGLFNTGVDSAGQPLPAGAVDPHWQIVSSPDSTASGPAAYVVPDKFPIPPWLANSATSKWIAPRADQSVGSAGGTYVYRLVFDLTGLDPTTATLSVQAAFDNEGVRLRLNGGDTGVQFPNEEAANYGQFSPLATVTAGFVSGTNVLEFVVENWTTAINPTGFRAELSGSAEPAVPPGTAPTVLEEPADQAVDFKGDAVFVARVRGSLPLALQWWRGAARVAGATNATLRLPSVDASMRGAYRLSASNAFGQDWSRTAMLEVVFPKIGARGREPLGPSSRRTGVVVSEIMYHPAPRADGRNLEFIELYNSNPFFEDLSGWRLTGDADYTFPTNTIMAGKSFLVVAAVPADVRAVYDVTNVVGGFSGQLANGDGTVRLRKRSGGIVLETVYADTPPWPVAADGAGPSLVLARPSLGEADPRAWSASSQVGGSPGRDDPPAPDLLSEVRFNEILVTPAAGGIGFVELRNWNSRALDLSGWRLRGRASASEFVIPQGTVVESGEVVSFANPVAGLDPAGDELLLLSPEGIRVVDALRFSGQVAGVSSGLAVDADGWRNLASPTPGAANAARRSEAVILNELHYHPTTGNDDEFVELRNRSDQAVDLAGWQLTGGIEFQFPPGAVIAPNGYLVVVADTNRFQAAHARFNAGQRFGNYQGSLNNGGERVTLERPEPPAGVATGSHPVIVDEVTFGTGGRWGRWADGGGSSLERVDARAGSQAATTWADSDESARAPWTAIAAVGVADMPHPSRPAADQLQVMLLGAGEVLIDGIEVVVGGLNRVANGTFESGVAGWSFQGTHRLSRAETAEGFQSARSLRLVASERGDHVANRVWVPLSTPVSSGAAVTIRAKARWLRGHPEVLLRLNNGAFEAVGSLPLPPSAGTPGAQNTREQGNTGPAITEVIHLPLLPRAGQAVRVLARLADPDGVAAGVLHYHLDPAGATFETAMNDLGEGADELAHDGIFSATLPGQAAGSLVAFWVEARDAATPTVASRFPLGAPAHECLVRFDEPLPSRQLGIYRLWLRQTDHDRWKNREKMSNEDVDGTFVYGTNRVIYAMGAHYSGSSYTAPTYNSPTGNPCGYELNFPKDDLFLGTDGAILDWPIRDDTNQREQLMYWFLEQLGLPNMYRRYVHLYVNGIRRSIIYDDVQQPARETVREWFSGADDGTLWKTDCWDEFDGGGNRISECVLNTLQRFNSGGQKKTARYRWNWRPRAVEGSANDFSDLFALVDLVNIQTNYVPAIQAGIDVDQWMRTFAMNDLASFWDAFGNSNGKNTFLYKPRTEGWKLMCWDFDVGLGVFNDPPTAQLFDANDPNITRMCSTPALVRPYWAALEESLAHFFFTGPVSRIDTLLQAKYAALGADEVPVANPAGIKTWIASRRAFLQQQLAAVRSDFAITSHDGTDFTSTNEIVNLTGRAPVGAAQLWANGVPLNVTWLDVTHWSAAVRLSPGSNRLQAEGRDRTGQLVAGATDTITVTYEGPSTPPPVIRINEWMAANRTALPNPTDGAFDDWFELYNGGVTAVNLAGYSLTDSTLEPRRSVIPAGFTLPAGGFLLVWADGQAGRSVGGDLHVNFKLSQEGEDIALYDPLGQLVDHVTFGAQVPDRSEGRWGDGGPEPFFALPTASPGLANPAPELNAASFGLIGGVDPSTGEFALSWRTVPGRTYQVESRDSLTGEWTPADAPVTATTTHVQWVEPRLPGMSYRLYRVRLLP